MTYKNCFVFIDGAFKKTNFSVKDGVFAEIADDLDGDVTDLDGAYVLPGLIDVHTHGCAGFDFSNADTDGVYAMTKCYASKGVTSVAATTMTSPLDLSRAAHKTIGDVIKSGKREGARILGVNMEGPFIGKDKKGAHNEALILPPTSELFDELDALTGGNIRIVDVDPRSDGAYDFIKKYSASRIVSLAHTSANYDEACKAFDYGAREVTHLFNAMNPLHHRDPGVIGAFADNTGKGVRAEIICDGFHIHPSAIRLMFKACPDNMVLISDSMCAAGMPDGIYQLGGYDVLVKDGKAVQADAPETIAGSATNVFQCLKNVATTFGIDKYKAIAAATSTPAKILAVDDKLGYIKPGYIADFVVIDEAFNLKDVYISAEKYN
ncbi:MAG: N-acetylglucosamine-6-phosphate deacetylase [Oscillospiraceae bacterium]|jgi:N-acetylglucosamine-6-phosphate deacetylase|nr:N-acetylglucosamine-6-phosphate deacetylase [Oscillospiraceae bacterium]